LPTDGSETSRDGAGDCETGFSSGAVDWNGAVRRLSSLRTVVGVESVDILKEDHAKKRGDLLP
jgi:hypothetical protein